MDPKVYDQIIEKQAALTSMLAKIASENRGPNDTEKSHLESLKAEVEGIKAQWESEGRRRFLESLGNPKPAAGPVILKADQKYADVVKGSYPSEFEGLSIGRMLRGYITGNYDGADLEMKAMASSPITAGGILIPTPISARVIDLARNMAAVMRAGAVVVPMDSSTLKMARVTQDVTANWYAEAGAIATSDAALDSVTFTARKLAALVAVNNELLEDAANVDAVIEQIIAQAMALKLDYTALCGSGDTPEPAGLLNVDGVNTVTGIGAPTYDDFITAIFEVRMDNYEPNSAIYAARTGETLAKLKDNDGLQLALPPDFAALSRYVSNQVPVNLGTGQNESLGFVGQWNQLAIGMRRNLTIEVAREGSYDVSGTVYSAFQKDQTLIRATLRADVQALQPAAFCVMSGITA